MLQNTLRKIWDEFEEGTSSEASFARVLDCLIPLIHNYYTQGRRWRQDGITYAQVLAVNQIIRENSPKFGFLRCLANKFDLDIMSQQLGELLLMVSANPVGRVGSWEAIRMID